MKKQPLNYSVLYDNHPEYISRRLYGTLQHQSISAEVIKFKLPEILNLMANIEKPKSILEIGCGTGEIIGHLSNCTQARCVGVDISSKNIDCARQRFQSVEFISCDASSLGHNSFDLVILSDILEHVDNDSELLKQAASISSYVILNIPLEYCLLYINRRYGPKDSSGHLRRYHYKEIISKLAANRLQIINHSRLWHHESSSFKYILKIRKSLTGTYFNGSVFIRSIKSFIHSLSLNVPILGRSIFPSSLFILAQSKSDSDS